MNEIKNRFELYQSKHPNIGDYICLCEVIKGMKYTKPVIKNSFLKLVSREEYDFEEKEEYINYLYTV